MRTLIHMNTLPPVIRKVRKLISTRLSPLTRQPQIIRRPISVQLEFPWLSKR